MAVSPTKPYCYILVSYFWVSICLPYFVCVTEIYEDCQLCRLVSKRVSEWVSEWVDEWVKLNEWVNEWVTFKCVVIDCIFLWGMQYFADCFSQNIAWHVKICSHNTCSLMSNKLFIIQLFQQRFCKHIWTKRNGVICGAWRVWWSILIGCKNLSIRFLQLN